MCMLVLNLQAHENRWRARGRKNKLTTSLHAPKYTDIVLVRLINNNNKTHARADTRRERLTVIVEYIGIRTCHPIKKY